MTPPSVAILAPSPGLRGYIHDTRRVSLETR